MAAKRFFSLFFLLLLIIACFYYFRANPNLLLSVRSIPLILLIGIILLQIINLGLNIWINMIIFRLKSDISIADGSTSTTLALILNSLIPFKAGSAYQAIFLKKKYNLTLLWFMGMFYTVSLIFLIISSLFGILSLVYLYFNFGIISLPLLMFYLIFLISAIYLQVIKRIFLKVSKKIRFLLLDKFVFVLYDIDRSFKILYKNKHVFRKLTTLIFLNILILLIITILEFKSLKIEISLVKILIFFSLSAFSIIINLTPGSIGIKEFVHYMFSSFLNLTKDNIILISIVDRTMLLVVFSGVLAIISFLKFLISPNASSN